MEKYECTDIDMVVAQCVDEIWQTFDVDNSGQLDFDEAKRFVKHTLSEAQDGRGKELSDDDFAQTFKEFDGDNSGMIDRAEMIEFLKTVAGL